MGTELRKDGYYQRKGIWVPSVTNVLGVLDKPALRQFYYVCGSKHMSTKEILETASEVGSKLHHFADNYLIDPSSVTFEKKDDQYSQAVSNFLKFCEEYSPIRVLGEETVYWDGEDCGCAGTLDNVLKVKDGRKKKLVLVDWKTSSGIYDSHITQTNAYFFMLQQMIAKEELDVQCPDEVWVVNISKKGEIKFTRDVVKFSPDERVFTDFLSLVRVFNGQKYLKEFFKQAKENSKCS